ncbi:MAG: folK [Gammaproteobacteria bacterium]|jgi:2-amino-4-hydroxy-6-hydroxymethyldihydropteridine diphosphokinase|nr:folK [Gammaproteobacteria bacterium]
MIKSYAQSDLILGEASAPLSSGVYKPIHEQRDKRTTKLKVKARRAYIGLGSNLNNPQHQLEQAISHLKALPESSFIKVSSFYQTKPVGFLDQPDFINAVAAIDTTLDPFDLLKELQQIENKQGRMRTQRFGPRTLDLDILLYGNQSIHTDKLIIPHPELLLRQFVIRPLLEIAPAIKLPDGRCVAHLCIKTW